MVYYFSKLGLVDSYTALILSHMLVGLPFIIWIMISSFESLPQELEDAARIDGCTLQEHSLECCFHSLHRDDYSIINVFYFIVE
ncbi:hypothetical protein ACI2OX_04805 [Bacillus sp. N9]